MKHTGPATETQLDFWSKGLASSVVDGDGSAVGVEERVGAFGRLLHRLIDGVAVGEAVQGAGGVVARFDRLRTQTANMPHSMEHTYGGIFGILDC